MVTDLEPKSTRRPVGMLCWLALFWALACSGPAHAAVFDHDHTALTSLLAKHVRWNSAGTATTVDYAALQRDRTALDTYTRALTAVTATEFSGWTTRQRRSFLINAYNAFTLQLILTRYPRLTSIRDLGNIVFNSPWKQRFFSLLGATRHLDEVEHELLRGAADFDEPRIHFAVNCASVGCPALRPEAYRADRLDAQLDDQTRRFLRDRSRNRLELNSETTASISPIFKWYRQDFEAGHHGWTTLERFLGTYADALGDSTASRAALRDAAFSVRYTDYSWKLNDRYTRP